MPDQQPPSARPPNARDRADAAERSSGKDDGDRVEADAQAEAEETERDSGGVSDET